jgi:hypothetical protein
MIWKWLLIFQDISLAFFWKWSLVIFGDLQESFARTFIYIWMIFRFLLPVFFMIVEIWNLNFGIVSIFSHHWLIKNQNYRALQSICDSRIYVCKPIIFLLLNSYIKWIIENGKKGRKTTTNYDTMLIWLWFMFAFM